MQHGILELAGNISQCWIQQEILPISYISFLSSSYSYYIDHRYTIMKTEPWKIIDISKTLLINSELLTRFSGWIAPTNWAIHDTTTTTASNNKELSIIQEARQGRARLVFRRRGVLELSLSH